MFIGAVAGVLLFIAPVSKSFLMFANYKPKTKKLKPMKKITTPAMKIILIVISCLDICIAVKECYAGNYAISIIFFMIALLFAVTAKIVNFKNE